MSLIIASLVGCADKDNKSGEFKWVADRFDDIQVLRYKVPGFEELPLQEKMLVYYLNQAALCGRDILYDQNFKYNLPIRRTLEAIYENYPGNRETPQWVGFEQYLKKVWFANGIHHHYSNEKFIPEFSIEYFDSLVAETPSDKFPQDFASVTDLISTIKPIIFNPNLYQLRVNQSADIDLVTNSANNYYEGVTQKEAEDFYAAMANPADTTPVSYGLNSKLMKANGRIFEKIWKVDGMYSSAIEKIVYWLQKATTVANEQQKLTINKLISYYTTGNLSEFDQFNVLWLADTTSGVDFVNGFTETYGDPLGYKASWEALVNFKDTKATKRTEAISNAAQWFEDNSPVDPRYKKTKVKGVSAKVITAAILGGDCYPATPIGINLPNADWIRKEHGSKSVTIQNITTAYAEAAKGNGFNEEFVLLPEDRARSKEYGTLADNLHTDLHECLGHGSGQLAPGTKGDELKNYGSTLEEARADLFALYYLADDKMIELGIVPSKDAYMAEYSKYIMNGMMTQLTRIQPGKNVEQAHMRNRKLIAEWCYERGKADNVIELRKVEGKTYVVVNDFEKLRSLFGEMLTEVQRIKSEGDFEAGKSLVEKYAVKVDPLLHKEVLERYAKLKLEPYSGFVNPTYNPVMENGEIIDIKIDYIQSYPAQMLDYSKNYSYLPSKN